MNKLSLPGWEPHFYLRSPLFDPLRHLAKGFASFESWPNLSDYQHALDQWPESLQTLAGQALKIVAQDGRPDAFEQHYAPRIYLTGEIQTRRENWHDFFQFLTWFMFPKTKAVINKMHLPYAEKRLNEGDFGRRSAIENMLSLFDEGGAVLVSSDESLLQLVRDFDWKTLFWQRRSQLTSRFSCIPFGHAMYEKALSPYIGMTANCILLPAETDFFAWNRVAQLAWVDEQLAALFEQGDVLQKPKDLSPFPILGMPDWDAANAEDAYYDNVSYFRPGRRRGALAQS